MSDHEYIVEHITTINKNRFHTTKVKARNPKAAAHRIYELYGPPSIGTHVLTVKRAQPASICSASHGANP